MPGQNEWEDAMRGEYFTRPGRYCTRAFQDQNSNLKTGWIEKQERDSETFSERTCLLRACVYTW